LGFKPDRLLDRFEFVEERSRWGAKFRFGLFAVSDHDMALIAQAMRADLSGLGLAPPYHAGTPLP
jgi:hypothetical protein